MDHAREAARSRARLQGAGAAGRVDSGHLRLRGHDLRSRLDELAAAAWLACDRIPVLLHLRDQAQQAARAGSAGLIAIARLLDGAAVAAAIKEELKPAVAAFAAAAGRPPGLALVLAGDDSASAIYVRSKEKSAAESGIAVHVHRLPASTSLPELSALVLALNADNRIDGILVQDPLPPGMGKNAS